MADTSGFNLNESILDPVLDALKAAPAYAELVTAGGAQQAAITERSVSGDGCAAVGFTIPQGQETYIVTGIRLIASGGELLGEKSVNITMEPGDSGLFYRVRFRTEIVEGG